MTWGVERRCRAGTTQNSGSGELSTLVGGLLTVGALFIASMSAMVSPWFALAAGLALIILGWIGLRMRVPRVLALITIAFGLVLVTLATLAYLPAR